MQSTAPIVQYDYQSPPASIPGFNLTEQANNNTLPSAHFQGITQTNKYIKEQERIGEFPHQAGFLTFFNPGIDRELQYR